MTSQHKPRLGEVADLLERCFGKRNRDYEAFFRDDFERAAAAVLDLLDDQSKEAGDV